MPPLGAKMAPHRYRLESIRSSGNPNDGSFSFHAIALGEKQTASAIITKETIMMLA